MALSLFGEVFRPTTDNANDTTQTVTITPPSDMVAGDVVIVFELGRQSSTTCGVYVDGGQSWTTASNQTYNYTTGNVHYCVFDGTWDTNPQFRLGASGVAHIGR